MSFGYSVGDFAALLKLANDLRNRFAQAPKQYNAIVNEVDHLFIVLNRITRLDDKELQEQQDEVKRVAHDCQTVLQELQARLDRFQLLADDSSRGWKDGIRRTWNRIRWDQSEIDGFRKRIEVNISMCNLLLSKINQDLVLETRQVIVSLDQKQDDQERRQILSWLSPIDPSAQQNEVFRVHQEGTGTWLLATTEFQRFVAGEEKTLFCPGIPGAGKTILSSVVIDHLERRFVSQSDVGITYFFCNYRQQQTTLSTFSALLRQLVRWQPTLPASITSMHKEFKKSGRLPSEEDVFRELGAAIASFSRVFLIIDALDECPLRDGVRSVRSLMLRKLLSLCEQHKVHILATSRPDQEISAHFSSGVSVEIQASRKDIESYVDERMDELDALIKRKPELKSDIKFAIVEAAKGMFLLARLYFNLLLDQVNLKNIQRMLEKFQNASESDAYQLAYDETVKRIDTQNPNQVNLAKRTIGWITNAKEPLKVTELEHAIAIEIGSSELDKMNITYIEQLTSFCCGLVIVDEQTSRVKLVHYTTQKYFESISDTWLAGIQEFITDSCLTYVSYDALNEDPFGSDYPLYHYAAQYWYYHFKERPGSEPLALKFLQSEASLSLYCWHTWPYESSFMERRYSPISGRWTGLHLTARLGLPRLLQSLLHVDDMSIEVDNPLGQTPLYLATAYGHQTTVNLLLEMGANPAGPRRRPGPIHAAARNGDDELVKLFLKKGVEVDSKSGGKPPLLMAASEGHQTTVQLLLANGANIESRDRYSGCTALLLAARKGHETIVRLLLSKGANIEAEDAIGQGLLHAAVESENEGLVRFIVAETRNIESGSQARRTSLHLALSFSRYRIAKLLLEQGAGTGSKDAGDARLLYLAASSRGHWEEIVNLLLQCGAALDPVTWGPQPLPRASSPPIPCKHSPLDIRRNFFLGISPSEHLNLFGRNIFNQAVFLEDEETARRLLESGAKPDVPDRFGKTPLFYAVARGDTTMVKLLLGLPDVDISRTDVLGITPADEARRRKFETISWMLERRGSGAEPKIDWENSADEPLFRRKRCVVCSGSIPEENMILVCGRTMMMICPFCSPAAFRVCLWDATRGEVWRGVC